MRVLICGGRNFDDLPLMRKELEKIKNITAIIHGGAKGADTQAGILAKILNIECVVYPADWSKHGKSAGPIRNAQMLKDGKASLVLAFPGGRGTANMISLASKAFVAVIKVNREETQ